MDPSVFDILEIIQKLLPDPSSWQFAVGASSPHEIVEWLHKEDYLYPPPEKKPECLKPPPEKKPALNSVKKPRKHVAKKKNQEGKACSHCKTTKSATWRTNTKTKEPECNACNLYESHNNRKRPVELWNTNSTTRKRLSSP